MVVLNRDWRIFVPVLPIISLKFQHVWDKQYCAAMSQNSMIMSYSSSGRASRKEATVVKILSCFNRVYEIEIVDVYKKKEVFVKSCVKFVSE